MTRRLSQRDKRVSMNKYLSYALQIVMVFTVKTLKDDAKPRRNNGKN